MARPVPHLVAWAQIDDSLDWKKGLAELGLPLRVQRCDKLDDLASWAAFQVESE
jgi:hypothetical protein